MFMSPATAASWLLLPGVPLAALEAATAGSPAPRQHWLAPRALPPARP